MPSMPYNPPQQDEARRVRSIELALVACEVGATGEVLVKEARIIESYLKGETANEKEQADTAESTA